MSSFTKNITRSDGLRAECKICDSIRKREYEKKNKHLRKANTHRRRARKFDADDGTITGSYLKHLKETETECYFCGDELQFHVSGQVHIDHLIPLIRGGAHTKDNIKLVCAKCNLSKGTKTAEEFLNQK